MAKTLVFVTNQFSCDRLIFAAQAVAERSKTQLDIVQILDREYDLDPKAIDYLFMLAKKANAIMRLVSAQDKIALMKSLIGAADVDCIVTGMPNSHKSVLYELWKEFPGKNFHVVDETGETTQVASSKFATA